MKLITSNKDLIVGIDYWVMEKRLHLNKARKPVMVTCKEQSGCKHLNGFWAQDDNSQALERWHIVGPITPIDMPWFPDYVDDLPDTLEFYN